MIISRRRAISSLLAFSTGLCRIAQGNSNRCVILTASREGPHANAINQMQAAFAAHSIGATTFRLPADSAVLEKELHSGTNQLAVAVGVDAVRAFAVEKSHLPLVATMAFRADVEAFPMLVNSEIKSAGAVWLDLQLSQIIAGIRVVFPNTTRVAVIHNSSQADSVKSSQQSRPLPVGVNLKTIECDTAADLLASMRKLRGQVDLVICLPDSKLYNKTTVEPLILSSLEHKLPLVGYSASFVRAGAAMGVYPDFNDVGRQTAAMAERYLSSPFSAREENPRRTTIAANERVIHLLGCAYKPKPGEDEVVVIR